MGESTGKSQDYAETWEGGFIRHDSKGRKVYVIRRMINGRSYKVSTRATTLRAAMEQLKRFETDPDHYNPAGSAHEQPINLDAPLAAEFLAYSRDVDKNSPTCVKKQQGYLAWWADQLKGRDLRKVTLLDDIADALRQDGQHGAVPGRGRGDRGRAGVSADQERRALAHRRVRRGVGGREATAGAGSFSFEMYGLAIKGACKAAGIPPFTPGRFWHSVATWAIEKGANPASVAAFLNHKSPTTTRRFYATHAVPAKIPTLA